MDVWGILEREEYITKNFSRNGLNASERLISYVKRNILLVKTIAKRFEAIVCGEGGCLEWKTYYENSVG